MNVNDAPFIDAQFRKIYEKSPLGIALLDAKGYILQCNPALSRILDAPEDHLVGLHFTSYLHPDEPEHPRKAGEILTLNALSNAQVERRVVRRDGSIIWTRSSVTFIVDDKSDSPYILSFVEDITEAHKIQQAESRQRALAEALRDAAGALNSAIDLDDVLEQILRQVGRVVPHDGGGLMLVEGNQAEVVRDWASIDFAAEHPSTLGLTYQIHDTISLRTMAEKCAPFVISDNRHRPGRVRHRETEWIVSYAGAPICIEGKVVGFINLGSTTPDFFTESDGEYLQVFANHAATAIRNARLYAAERQERALAQTYQKTAEALARSNSLADALNLVIDYLSEIVEYDHAMILWVKGDTLEVAAERSITGASQDLQKTFDYCGIPLLYQTMQNGEPLILFCDADDDPILADLPAVESNTRRWVGIPIIARDVIIGLLVISISQPASYTNQTANTVKAFTRHAALAIENSHILAELEASQSTLQEARAHLTRAARLSVAGEIAAGVAHQINNPLTTIVAQTHLLLRRLAPDSKDYNAVKSIKEAAYRAGTVVQRMLDFSKTTSYRITTLDVNESVLDAISLVRAQIEPHISRISTDLQSDLPMIRGSKEHLEDVWINVLLNARDALVHTHKGVIKITTRYIPERASVQIIIQDNGPGIPAETLPFIFDPFVTTKSKGTGLGLSICQDVILTHGGTMTVQSEEGAGAAFTIYLPTLPHFDPVEEEN